MISLPKYIKNKAIYFEVNHNHVQAVNSCTKTQFKAIMHLMVLKYNIYLASVLLKKENPLIHVGKSRERTTYREKQI